MRDRDVGTLVADTVPRLTVPSSHTRCFRLSCDALSSRAAILSISQVRETEASGSEPQPQAVRHPCRPPGYP